MKTRGARDKAIFATKVGIDMGDCKKGLLKPYVLRATEDLLRELQTDYIDQYQSHLEAPKYLGIDLPCFYIVEKLSPVEPKR